MKKQVITNQAPEAVGPYSQAIEAEGFLFLSGQIAIDPETNTFDSELSVEEQTHQVMRNLQGVLEAEDLTLDHLVRVDISLIDMNDFRSVNTIYGSYFAGITPPARQTVEVSKLPLGAHIEISGIAVKKK